MLGPVRGRGVSVFFNDSIAVETFLGTDGLGKEIFAPAVTVTGYADQKRQMTRTADGEEAVSNTTIYTDLAHQGLFTPNTRVTINGDTTIRPRVLLAQAFSVASIRLPEHLAVTLG